MRLRTTVETFCYPGGISDFLEKLVHDRTLIDAQPFYYSYKNDLQVEIAMAWTEQTSHRILSFVNSIPTPNGGTHETAFRNGITRAVRAYIEKRNGLPKGLKGDLSRGRERGLAGNNFRLSARQSGISRARPRNVSPAKRHSKWNRWCGMPWKRGCIRIRPRPRPWPAEWCLPRKPGLRPRAARDQVTPKGCHATAYAPRQIGGLFTAITREHRTVHSRR